MVNCPSLSTGTFTEKVWGRAPERGASAEFMPSRSWVCWKPFQPHKTLGFFISISEVAQWWEMPGATKDTAQWHYLTGAYGSRKNDHRAGAAVMDRCWMTSFLGWPMSTQHPSLPLLVLRIALRHSEGAGPEPVGGRAMSQSKLLSRWNEDMLSALTSLWPEGTHPFFQTWKPNWKHNGMLSRRISCQLLIPSRGLSHCVTIPLVRKLPSLLFYTVREEGRLATKESHILIVLNEFPSLKLEAGDL